MLQEMRDLRYEACISGCNVACAGAPKEAPSKRAFMATINRIQQRVTLTISRPSVFLS
jgi:hypothetical protein